MEKARTNSRSASINKPIVQRRVELSLGPPKQSLKPRINESRETTLHKQTKISTDQIRYPSNLLNSKYDPTNYSDCAKKFNFNNEKPKQNYLIDRTSIYNKSYNSSNHYLTNHDELAASIPNKLQRFYEDRSANVSNRTDRQEIPSFRRTSNTIEYGKPHTTQESKDHISYLFNSTVKPVYGNSVCIIAGHCYYDQYNNPYYPSTRMPMPPSVSSLPEDNMKHQHLIDPMRNIYTNIDKASCSSNLVEVPQKPVSSSSGKINSAKKQLDAPEYQESRPCTKTYSENQRFVRGGLPNTGLTCYMNSILQCLFASEPFMEKIKGIKRPGEVTALFREIYAYTLAPRDPSETYEVRDLLKCLAKELGFELSRENDAHAFYITLIDRLMEEEPSLDEFFAGELQVTGKCDGCGPINTFEESFTELALPSKKNCPRRDLIACIDFCFKPKQLECCKCHGQKTRKPTLICAPEILVLLSEENVREDIWIEDKISIPISKERIFYTLLGVVEYTGSGNYGHYTA